MTQSHRFVRSLFALTAMAGGLGFASSAFADCAVPQTFTVANTADDGSPDTLRFLVGSAQDCDTVEVPAGTYLFDPAAGYIFVDKSITVRGAGSDVTILDANGANTAQGVFAVDALAAGAFLTLEGVTLQGSETSAIGVVNKGGLHVSDSLFKNNKSPKGAGILVSTGAGNQVVVDRCVFQGNEAINAGSGVGGAIFSEGSAARVQINETVIEDNVADVCAVAVQTGSLEINGGRISGNEALNNCGGVAGVTSSVVISGTEISGNTAVTGIGGVGVVDSDALISNAKINDNVVTGGPCGGLAAESQTPPNFTHVTLVDSTVDGNRSSTLVGGVCGGLLASNPVSLAIDRTTVSNNLSDTDDTGDGGGGGIGALGSVVLSNSWVHGNTANASSTGGGGGVLVVGSLTMTSTLVEGNTIVRGPGGGVITLGTSIVANSTIAGNRATGDNGVQDAPGGGVAVVQSGLMTLLNSTVVGNEADGGGGGLLTDDGAIYAVNSTIALNVADANSGGVGVGGNGGGFLNGLTLPGLMSLTDSIVAGNVDASAGNEGPDCFSDQGGGALVGAGGANIVQSLDGCDVTSGSASVTSGIDPLFDASGLAENGGPSVGDPDSPAVLKTLALQAESPAIDAATGAGCPENDGRGVARPIDGNGDGEAACDLGAFEAPTPDAGGETTGGTTGGETTGGTTGGEDGGGGCSLIR